MVSIFSVPEKITLEIGDKTLRLFHRIVDLYANSKEVKELMEDLNTSSEDLAKKVNENPDPNPND